MGDTELDVQKDAWRTLKAERDMLAAIGLAAIELIDHGGSTDHGGSCDAECGALHSQAWDRRWQALATATNAYTETYGTKLVAPSTSKD